MRTKSVAVALLLAATAAVAATSSAHALRDGLYGPGKLQLAGRSMSCGKVPTLVSKRYWMPAGSIQGLIGINPKKLKSYSRVEQWFIYTHECGHQHIGTSERRADCWGASKGRQQGWLDRNGIARICHTLRNDPAKDGYPSGKARCQIMRRCYNQAG
jgi:hypothetical protein